MKINDIREIMKEMNINDIDYFQYEGEGIKLKLKKGRERYKCESFDKTVTKDLEPEELGLDKEILYSDYIKSPIVGTFYSKPSPDKETFVKSGDIVKKGKILCIVEAMKVMNEIVADQDIKILDILVANEDIVEYGQKLFGIEKL